MKYVTKDLKRLDDCFKKNNFIKAFFYFPQFRYIVSYRICKKLHGSLLYFIFRVIMQIQGNRWGMSIPISTDIGPGLRIDHFGGIWLSRNTKIGKNCSISSGVALGYIPRGLNKGTPKSIGDNVYIGPGAKILGNITIGNNVIIGANSVVTKSLPDNVTVFGVPARIIAHEGSDGYINNGV